MCFTLKVYSTVFAKRSHYKGTLAAGFSEVQELSRYEIPKNLKVLPRFELGFLDSKSNVLTITL